MSSIIAALTNNRDSRLAEIKLMLSAFTTHKKLIVVEGPDDKALYERFYDSSDYEVYYSSEYPGCLGFDDVCRQLSPKYQKKLIMIKDADFDKLKGINYEHLPNFFLTDRHDLETMLVQDSFYEAVKTSYGIEMAETDVLDIMNHIVYLSYLKWMNSEASLGISFKKKGRASCCYCAAGCVGINIWLANIAADPKNASKTLPSPNNVAAFEQTHPLCESLLWEMTNGHDLTSAICVYLNSKIHSNVSKDTVIQLLFDSFTEDDYHQTNLCKNIENWIASGYN